MTVAVEEPAVALGRGHGGMPARRAVVRWAWRLFRREWRQQFLVLALLITAVAATSVGLGLAANAAPSQNATFGTADYRITYTGTDIEAGVASAQTTFGSVEVITHQKVAAPGSATGIDLRAQDPHGKFSHPTLRLTEGRYPAGAGEVAVTARAARLFKLHVGGAWTQGTHTWSVVGLVENPLNLLDTFALVAPGQATPPEEATILIAATPKQFAAARLPNGAKVDVRPASGNDGSTSAVLILATVGLLFVGLLAVAGFTVMAQRRLRALGMLGALGASQRHIRLVMLANGAVVGTVAALIGTALGLGLWFLLRPRLEGIVQYRIDPFNVPWWGIAVAMLLAVVTAVVAAWWPARTVARVSVMAALASRPAPPSPAHRFAIWGGLLLLAGLGLIFESNGDRRWFIIGGVAATVLGMLMLAPLGVAILSVLARISPVAVRLALRDLARYQARSGAALAAVSLAVGISAAIVIGAAAAQAASAVPPKNANLPGNELIVWFTLSRASGLAPQLSTSQLQSSRTATDAIAATVHAQSVLTLEAAISPNSEAQSMPGGLNGKQIVFMGKARQMEGGMIGYGEDSIPMYVATPELLRWYGIDAASIDPTTDILSSHSELVGYDLVGLGRERPKPWQPKVQRVSLPTYTSAPVALITPHAMQTFGLTSAPIGWSIRTPQQLTPSQIDTAQVVAAAAGVNIETGPPKADLSGLRTGATVSGIAVALGVLAMTVGLIRSGSARDLRTLTATGAPSRIRRTLTAATATALAMLGAILGTIGAYLALLAWYHSSLQWLGHVPVVSLAIIVVGMPLVACVASWLLAGREPPTIARAPIE
jgi:putative ABC transport system permease protein